MPLRRVLLFFMTAIAVLAPRVARADIARPVVDQRLANGMRLIVSPDPGAADVTVHLRYDTGSRDEPPGLEGMAHLVEHLMFLGTRHAPGNSVFQLLERAGATNINGTTSSDATTYYETLPPERLELALWLESDRMAHALRDVDAAKLDTARAEVQNEHQMRVASQPLGALHPYTHAALFPSWHPYAYLPVGTLASIQRITAADARAFANTWYGPDNATLVITGKVDPSTARALAEKYFGTLPRARRRSAPRSPRRRAWPRSSTSARASRTKRWSSRGSRHPSARPATRSSTSPLPSS
ncbi:zinc protease [Minicystis rosea]|nr:zinc protease [Minicystis rosea]